MIPAKSIQAREIITDTLARLKALGMEPENAAALLVIQGAIRITQPKEQAACLAFVKRQFEE